MLAYLVNAPLSFLCTGVPFSGQAQSTENWALGCSYVAVYGSFATFNGR